MKKQNVRTISLIVCTFTYLLVGAAVFDALESETEKRRWEVLENIENMVKSKYNISHEDFKIMETVVLKAEPHKAGQQWKFPGAFYYATTVLTTIGYGHSTPCTIGGKLFTMFYAIVGIPLGLVMFQSIGERVNRLSSVIICWVKKALHCKQTQASELDLICVVTTLSSMVIAGGAAAFSKFEGWSYFDSVYYCFITLTTIGFGDMVALQKDNALNSKLSYVIFALIFILFGLAIVAACLNLLVLRFVTMNTEDEKRDEQQAIQALRGAVRLEGDVITADGEILRGVSKGTRLPADPREILQSGTPMLQYSGDEGESAPSVCSCSCNCFGQQKPPHYHDPLSPIPPPMKMGKASNKQGAKQGLLTRVPRYIEKSKNLSQSGTLRLNSASGYLFMNAKNPEFNIEEEDFRELVRRRREQLMDRTKNMLNYDTFRSNMERPSKLTSPSETDGRYMSSQLYESRRSSFFSFDGRSENEKRSHDPLVEDSYKEDHVSYSKRKLMKNVDRNIKDKKKKTNKDKPSNTNNYFYDDAGFRLGDCNILDSSKVFSKRKNNDKSSKKNAAKKGDDTSVCVYRGGRQQEYSWNIRRNDYSRNSGDQLSNDGSYGYYLTNEDDNEFSFINDTLTFTQPPHRASI